MDANQTIHIINIDNIIPNRFQPRLTFDEQALNELSASIKEHGIIQPLVIRQLGDKYEIVAGERRYKAATLAGLTEVPCIIVNFDDNKSAEVALIENVQRRNLSSIEEAKSYKKILDKNYLTQEELAKKLGVSQSTIANKIRLLNLSDNVQEALLNEKISERHARSLLQIPNQAEQDQMLNRITSERMTVRQLDTAIKDKYGVQGSSETEASNILPSFDTLNFDLSQTPVVEESVTPVFEIRNEKQVNPVFENVPSEEPVMEALEVLTDSEPESEPNPFELEKPVSRLLNIFDRPEYLSLEDQQVNLAIDNSASNIFDTEPEEEKKDVVVDIAPESIINEVIPETNKPRIEDSNLDSVVAAYKELEKEIRAAGFKIISEDFDFEDLYQIIIKIDKQE